MSTTVWPTACSAARSSPAPTCWETSATAAAVMPIATETNSHAVGNISETAATDSASTRPTQNMSARLYAVWSRLPTTSGHASEASFGVIAPVVMSTRPRSASDTGRAKPTPA